MEIKSMFKTGDTFQAIIDLSKSLIKQSFHYISIFFKSYDQELKINIILILEKKKQDLINQLIVVGYINSLYHFVLFNQLLLIF